MPLRHLIAYLALGLVAAGSLVYAWQLNDRLAAAEALRLTMEKEAATLQHRVAELEKSVARPPSYVARPTPAAPGEESETGPAPNVLPPGPPGTVPGDRAPFVNFRDSPEMQRLFAMQRKAALDGRYAALFRNLNLAPADLERFKALLVEKQSAAGDVFAAARSQGLNPRENRDQIRQLITSSEAEIDASIQGTLGEGVYQQYKQYEQTMPQRNLTTQLEQRLSYSAAPLTTDQTERLVVALANGSPTDSTSMYRGASGLRATVTDAAIAASQSFLSPVQVDALRQIQQEQAAQAQLRRQASQNRNNPNGGPPGPPSRP